MSKEGSALKLFEEMLAIPCPSGREEQMAAHVRAKLQAMGYKPETDPAGNVLVRVPGKKPERGAMAVASHMDEIGMVVTRVEKNSVLRVSKSGGLTPWKIGEGAVDILGDSGTVKGVYSMGSGHVAGLGEKGISWDNTWVLTGQTAAQLDAAGVRVGSTAVPVKERRGPVLLGKSKNPLVGAWTFDDRMGVVALLRLLQALKKQKLKPVRPLLVCFTVHEEGGCHGAVALAQREKPELFLAVDGCPIPPGQDLQLDGRPGVWSKDRICHFDQKVVRALHAAARRAGTSLQTAVFDNAASDASRVYQTGAAPRVATFGHVRENSHGYEVARLSVFDNVLKTLVAFVKTWDG